MTIIATEAQVRDAVARAQRVQPRILASVADGFIARRLTMGEVAGELIDLMATEALASEVITSFRGPVPQSVNDNEIR